MASMDENVDVALYVDELKSDDPLLKINAIAKLGVIANALSKTRIEEELIPYLAFIITEQDNEDEFLFKLSENLLAYLRSATSVSKSKAIKLFEPLATLEDPNIRQSAVRALTFIASDSQNEVLQCLYRLSNFSVPSKVSTMEITGGLIKAGLYDGALLKELEKLTIVAFNDNAIPVRRAAIRALGAFWAAKARFGGKSSGGQELKCLSQPFIEEFIKGYSSSTTESVLFELLDKNLCSALISAADEALVSRLIDSVVQLLSNKDISWRIKYMTVSAHELWVQRPERMSQFAESMKVLFKEEEQEVKSAIVRAFGAFFVLIESAVTAEALWDSVKEFIKSEVATDKNIYIREAFISLLRQMLVNRGRSSIVSSAAMELFEGCAEDFSQESKLKGLDFIESFFCGDKLQGVESMLERLEQLASDKNWRLRLTLLEKLEKVISVLLKQPSKAVLLQKLSALNLKFRDDLVFAVRLKMLDNLLLQVGKVNGQNTEPFSKFKEVVSAWVSNRNYIFRVSGLQALARLVGVVSSEQLTPLAEQVFGLLSGESIPNVKINMLKALLILNGAIKEELRQRVIQRLSSDWTSDSDRDVKALLAQANQSASLLVK